MARTVAAWNLGFGLGENIVELDHSREETQKAKRCALFELLELFCG
jgi:hypothetical protein